jgi:hypothetical protein
MDNPSKVKVFHPEFNFKAKSTLLGYLSGDAACITASTAFDYS